MSANMAAQLVLVAQMANARNLQLSALSLILKVLVPKAVLVKTVNVFVLLSLALRRISRAIVVIIKNV